MPSIKVARITSNDKPLEVGTAEKPVPGPNDVLVKVDACGLVPNTVNIVTSGGPFIVAKAPLVFGLDASGTIESVGEHVQNLKVGDRVYVNPGLTCGTCLACRRGDVESCPAYALRGYFAETEAGAKTLNRYPIGAMSEYLTSPGTHVRVLPDSIDLDTAARFGYIGTSYAALRKANVGPATTVVINGVTGTLGYAAVAIALGLGATKILGIGRNKERLAEVAALSNGKRLKVVSSLDEEDLAAWVKKETGGEGPDVMIDCLGNGGDANTTVSLIKAIRRRGTAVLVAGGADGDITQNYLEAMMNSITIVGSMWFTTGQCDELVALVDAGVVDLSFLKSKHFSLDDVNEAIKFVGDRPGGSVNVVVKPGMGKARQD